MSLTKPRFVHSNTSEVGNSKRSIFDVEAFVNNVDESTFSEKKQAGLITTAPIFQGKEKPENDKPSVFDFERYNTDFEDPGVYSLVHFDEPVPNNENAYQSRATTASSLISAGHFAISSVGTSRAASSLYPMTPTKEMADYYLKGLIKPAMEPDEKIDLTVIRRIIKGSLSCLEDETYDTRKCRNLSKALTDYLLYQLKALEYDRYKFICNVHVGQNLAQDIRISSRFLWNDQTDTFISESYKSRELFAVAIVYAIYQE